MIRHTDDPPNAEAALSDLKDGVPIDRFYVRCNFPVPALDVRSWRLDLVGAFERPRTWTLDELAALPAVERTITLECAGNGRALMTPTPPGTPWGLGAVSTASFGGIRLVDLLAECRPRRSVVELVFTGADRGAVEPEGAIPYQFNLDLATATTDGPMLAWTMGGEPLTPEHGFPVRLVVPGHYGMRSVKWLTSITAVEHPFGGHFPRKYRYRGEKGVPDETPVGPMRVRSLFTWPLEGARLAPQPVTLRGIAWSGEGQVTDVEIGIDGSWLPARVEGPLDGTGPVSWALPWSPTHPGRHLLEVRATDEAGNRQPTEPIWNEGGYGNNVIHRVTVEVGLRPSSPT
ncbi:MAG TPA: sulfite oxidase [Candidatus Limnocylindria bacterium]